METKKVPRALGLDIGDARIGVAMSDPLGITAQPLCSVEVKGKKTISELVEIVEQNSISTIVAGFPYELSGEIGEQAKKVEKFLGKLKEALEKRKNLSQVEILTWDERLTSVAAERVLAGSGLKNRKRRAALDRISAALILDSFLQSRPHS